MLRLIKRLGLQDLSLCHSMIPLGSCTMKLNAASEMDPVSWPEFSAMHPFAPESQTEGWKEFSPILAVLGGSHGFAGVSCNPMLVLRRVRRVDDHPGVPRGPQRITPKSLVPTSAHGTNPASAVMAGMTVVPLQCDERGDLDMADLEAKIAKHGDDLAIQWSRTPPTAF